LVLRVRPLVNIKVNEKKIKKINKIEYNGSDRNKNGTYTSSPLPSGACSTHTPAQESSDWIPLDPGKEYCSWHGYIHHRGNNGRGCGIYG
jgi:hypothetical protein